MSKTTIPGTDKDEHFVNMRISPCPFYVYWGYIAQINSDVCWWIMPSLVKMMACLDRCWVIFNWTLGSKFQWNFNQFTNIFIEENCFQNVFYKMSVILSQCIRYPDRPVPSSTLDCWASPGAHFYQTWMLTMVLLSHISHYMARGYHNGVTPYKITAFRLLK